MPADKPLTPEERLEALRFGRLSKLKGEMKARASKKEKTVKKAKELGVFDRAIQLATQARDRLFGAEKLKEAAKQ